MFDWMRDEILEQLALGDYVGSKTTGPSPEVEVARGLAPEPFFLALENSGIRVVPWLEATLSQGQPNAAHVALAQLATAGAKVWTVNFDHLIEEAATPPLTVLSWGADPTPGAQVLKPHGTLGQKLIVTAEQVLQGLEPLWEQRLRQDVRGRTVVFLGYSGRDLDFHPIWDDVLRGADRVIWVGEDDMERKRLILRSVAAAGRLEFLGPAATPLAGAAPNQSWDFVDWCQRNGLVNVPADLIDQLFAAVTVTYPRLTSDSLVRARAQVQEILGSARAARRGYLKLLGTGPERLKAAHDLVGLTMNHGRRPTALALGLSRLIPPVGRLAGARQGAERKRLTVLAKLGRHSAVLKATEDLPADSVSTLFILRSASLRFSGSLTDAARVAEEATERAHREGHNVRIAHAAYQWCQALLWAERLDEARECLEEQLTPYAAIAASRWVAWANFIRACLLVRDGDADKAMKELLLGEARFRSEALTDGIVSIEAARLTALRLAGDDAEFERLRDALSARISARTRSETYYARGHRFTRETVALEEAEYLRVHRHDLTGARPGFTAVASSPYPLHAALGELGLALVDAETTGDLSHAQAALDEARKIGAGLVVERAQALLSGGPPAGDEVFFC